MVCVSIFSASYGDLHIKYHAVAFQFACGCSCVSVRMQFACSCISVRMQSQLQLRCSVVTLMHAVAFLFPLSVIAFDAFGCVDLRLCLPCDVVCVSSFGCLCPALGFKFVFLPLLRHAFPVLKLAMVDFILLTRGRATIFGKQRGMGEPGKYLVVV
jgi:hypothetical protein